MGSNVSGHGALHAQVLELLHAFGKFGRTEAGGISRLAASAEDKAARDHLCRWLKAHGFVVLVDAIGNIFGVLDFGVTDTDRVFFSGSHLDSQPNGGNYDGCLGVVCACIAALHLKSKIAEKELVPTYRYYVVSCWTGEEGARFQPSLIGSSVFEGTLELNDAWGLTDAHGISLKDALSDTGYLGSDEVPRPHRYLELHIEQGARLEASGNAIGLVDACWGASKLRLQVKGKADHTGPTPMEDRRNALLAAAHIVVAVEAISEGAEDTLYSSVGRMTLSPNSPNTVVDDAELWVEFRSAHQGALDDAEAALEAALITIGKKTGCDLSIVLCERRKAIRFDETAILLAGKALARAGITHQRLDTIAGHDAIRLHAVCPSTLLFVPSKDGITHSPLEFTSDEDVCAGFDAMIVVLAELIAEQEVDVESRRAIR